MQLIKIPSANCEIGICCGKGINAGLWKHSLDEYERKEITCIGHAFHSGGPAPFE